ncbi:hypothetical protein BYT27DRAFT_7342492 [Phlegmacium glaucopus]|nr:hypothetical protein BYT27DRAFT_7342492 [Phlegmacium glaucopus]
MVNIVDTLILYVKVDKADLDILKEGGFNLCLTRDVKYGARELKGNVVFSMVPAGELGPTMELSWEDKYQVFEVASYQSGTKVELSTEIVDIEGGQLATFDANGRATITGSPMPGPFSVSNEWHNLAHIGVKHFAGDYVTIFISPKVPLVAVSSLLPSNNYRIFWDTTLETGIQFDHTSTEPYEFTNDGQITLEYKNRAWSILN